MPNPEGFNGTRKSRKKTRSSLEGLIPNKIKIKTPAPDEDVRPWAKYYFERGYKAKEIADKLKKHYDTDKYKLR